MRTTFLMISGVLLVGLFGISFFLTSGEGIFLPLRIFVDDMLSDYDESVRKSNYDTSYVLDCNDTENPYNEYECFRDSFSNCYNAVVNPDIYTMGDEPVYAKLKITPDCTISATVDTVSDRFAIPKIITTECLSVGRGDSTWTVGICDIESLHEMHFDFEMQSYQSGYDLVSSQTNPSCMTIEQSKSAAPFFKTPAYLPEGYFHVCSQSGTPSESYIVYHHKEILNWNIPELISDGAIFIYQIDERNIVDEEKLATLGTAEQRIQETYDGVMKGNPSLQPQLLRINGMLAYTVDSCPDCGIQTANFTDGTFIQKSTSTETKIKFIDEDGVNYMLKTTLPLDELILVAKSLR